MNYRPRRRGSYYSKQYQPHRYQLLKTEGECNWCGDTEQLEYHHLQSATRYGEKTPAILLCRSCHQQETRRQLNMHKAVGMDGYRLHKSIKRHPPRRAAVDELAQLVRRISK